MQTKPTSSPYPWPGVRGFVPATQNLLIYACIRVYVCVCIVLCVQQTFLWWEERNGLNSHSFGRSASPPQTFSLMEILKKQKWHLYLLLCVAGCSDAQHVSEQCESLSSHHKWYLLMSNLFFNTTQIPSLCGLGGSHAQNYFSTSWVWCVRVLYLKKNSFIHSSSVCWGFTLWMVLF